MCDECVWCVWERSIRIGSGKSLQGVGWGTGDNELAAEAFESESLM